MNSELIPVTEQHLVYLQENAPFELHTELWSQVRLPVYFAAKECVERSEEVYTVSHNSGKLLGITGVMHKSWMPESKACPYLLNTRFFRDHPRDLLVHTKRMINKWLETWEVLEGHIDSRYEQTVRWAKWAGFTIHPPELFGPDLIPFHTITIRK